MNPRSFSTRSGHTIAADYIYDIAVHKYCVSCPYVPHYKIPIKSCTGRILTHLEEPMRPKICLGSSCTNYNEGLSHKGEILRDRRAPTTLGARKVKKGIEDEEPTEEELEEIETSGVKNLALWPSQKEVSHAGDTEQNQLHEGYKG